jgi:hypothetical protein
VLYLGNCDKAAVIDRFARSDLFIAPIDNDYGSKIKLLECLAHGTPFVATSNALSGLPFLTCVPKVNLNSPAAAAQVVMKLVSEPGRLTQLAMRLEHEVAEFQIRERGSWGRLIGEILN